ncbi:hypothetical protein PPL_02833 [Heterostelium album PN500]|uniref:B box-type domain-containing protein n=1 Tax=Heterostelium pallidum (strain ATCC 26659 / Pp 5 / PN500) TaxID=670386 RepID=D3B368_HETP5|nr:hypothetical protein PPL_02833 [Heterostelium album PN500]EFA83766.1 hypothetical protein PPL_02833 [Heterostelium album PN500]|eukprot:XP_020435883.1 hypothetical protein PPL_02833 [Heterostelium album PN500]
MTNDTDNNIKSMSCIEHNKSFKVICFTCNKLLCLRCSFNHIKDQPDHCEHSEHIDDIKQALKDISNNDNSENSVNNYDNNSNIDNISDKKQHSTFIESRIDSIWKSLKSSSERYQTLTAKENQIKQHFEQLHQHLITEEHKLKKDIIDDIDKITNEINDNVNELKHLNNILNMNINLMSMNDDHSNNSSSSNDGDSVVLDTTEQYSTITSIISISSSSSLLSFIKDNRQTLFNDNNKKINTKEQLEQYSNNPSLLLLDSIYKYNNQFQPDRMTGERVYSFNDKSEHIFNIKV